MRVVEFGTYLAAPLTGRYLADVGLDVVCVVRPSTARGAADERAWADPMAHDLRRGKTVVELDLRTEEGRRRAHDLVRSCDVVLENFGRGVADRLGIGYEACRALNARLVYVSLPGYSRHDDAHQLPPRAWDSVIMASTGVFSDMGLNRTLLGVTASFSSLPMPSVYASIFGALATVTALLNRHDDGQFVEVPLASALSEALVHNSLQVALDDRYRSRRAVRVRDGPVPVSPEELDDLMDPFFCRYVCADGRPVYLVCPAHARHQRRALACLGVSAADLGIPTVDAYARDAPDVFGIGAGRLSEAQCAVLRPHMRRAFRRRPSHEWEAVMGARGVPIAAHRATDEWIDTPHARESGLTSIDAAGRRGVGPLTWTNADVGVRAARRSYATQTTRSVRVLDLCNVIAGPTIGRMMARMGARVTKVDPVHPLYAPDVTIVYGMVVNIGKESMLVDVQTPHGRAILEELVRESDVVLTNATSECLARLGLTDDAMAALNPDAILLRFDAWGGAREDRGSMAQYVGYDDNVQAAIGIMERFGGGLETVEEHAHVGTIDVIAGVAGAFGVMAALLARKRSGEVRQVRTSLAAVGQYLQYPFMFGRPVASLGRGVACRGVHPGHRVVRCADGRWMLVVETLARPTEGHGARLASTATVEDACAALRRADVSCGALRTLADVVRDHRVARPRRDGGSYQYVTVEDHPLGCVVMVAPVAIRARDVDYGLSLVAPKVGCHTSQILARLATGRRAWRGALEWSAGYLPAPTRCDACGTRPGVVGLSCDHTVCCACLERHRHVPTCPSCARPHVLDRETLRSITTQWRRAYGAWRRGAPRGATDLERLYRPAAHAPRRAASSPDLASKARLQLTSPTSTLALATIASSGVNA